MDCRSSLLQINHPNRPIGFIGFYGVKIVLGAWIACFKENSFHAKEFLTNFSKNWVHSFWGVFVRSVRLGTLILNVWWLLFFRLFRRVWWICLGLDSWIVLFLSAIFKKEFCAIEINVLHHFVFVNYYIKTNLSLNLYSWTTLKEYPIIFYCIFSFSYEDFMCLWDNADTLLIFQIKLLLEFYFFGFYCF